MAIKVPPHPVSTQLSQIGDVEIDAFGNIARIVGISGGLPALPTIADQRVLGNDSGTTAAPSAITVHQELDWISGDAVWIFDGIDDRVSYGDFNDFERTDSFSVSAWIQTPSLAAQQTIVGKLEGSPGFRGWELGLGTGNLYFILCSTVSGANWINAQTTASSIPVGGLVHVVVTYSGTSLSTGVQFYINGNTAAQGTPVGPGPITTTTLSSAQLVAGLRGSNGTFPFAGKISNISVFNYVLSAGQVTTLYNSGSPSDISALIPQFWTKLDAVDTTGAGGVVDYGSGAHNGTASGGLSQSTQIGAIIARSSSIWQTILPEVSGLPFVSNGVGALPGYRQLGTNGMPSYAAESFLGNFTGSTAIPTARAGSSVAGGGLAYVAGGTLQRAALTGAVTASQGNNTTAFGSAAAKSVLANATNASAVPAFLAGTGAFQYLRVNSGNTGLEWAVISVASPITQTTGTIGFDQTVVLGNNARVAVSKNSGATVGTRRRINLIEGTGVTLTIADDSGNEEVDVTIASGPTAATVNPTHIAIFGTPTNTGVPFIIYVSFAAGAGGSPDDVTIFSSTAPFNFRILEAWQVTATAVAAATVQARTATGGLGSALTTTMSATVTGKTSDNSTATTTVASGGTMVLRRSDSGVAGEFFAMCVRT